jgi:hypothetical protein
MTLSNDRSHTQETEDTMEWHVTDHERAYLRDLAAKQAEYAALPIMAERKKMWFALNDGRAGSRPPVIVENWTFDRDFLPEAILRCTTDTGLLIERQLLRNIRNHELIDDDKVIPDTFDFDWFTEVDEFGVAISCESVKDAGGIETGYHFLHPVKDLNRDIDMLQPAACRVDRQKTLAWRLFLEDLFEGVLGVRLRTGMMAPTTMLTYHVVRLMGMERFFMAMYDCPEKVHQLMAYLRDNAMRVMRWSEREGLLRVNNGNEFSFGSSYNFTNVLPSPEFASPAARMCDMWGCANSQETIGISPEMFHEFCFPYYRDMCEPMGLLYYGCCEPAHPFWSDIRQLPHLKKISISRWCDQQFMGEALQGTNIVFSRKPDPKFLGVHVKLDEEDWAAHIRDTLDATRGVFLEFIIRDVYTVHGDLSKPHRAVEVARREIDRYGSR